MNIICLAPGCQVLSLLFYLKLKTTIDKKRKLFTEDRKRKLSPNVFCTNVLNAALYLVARALK